MSTTTTTTSSSSSSLLSLALPVAIPLALIATTNALLSYTISPSPDQLIYHGPKGRRIARGAELSQSSSLPQSSTISAWLRHIWTWTSTSQRSRDAVVVPQLDVIRLSLGELEECSRALRDAEGATMYRLGELAGVDVVAVEDSQPEGATGATGAAAAEVEGDELAVSDPAAQVFGLKGKSDENRGERATGLMYDILSLDEYERVQDFSLYMGCFVSFSLGVIETGVCYFWRERVDEFVASSFLPRIYGMMGWGAVPLTASIWQIMGALSLYCLVRGGMVMYKVISPAWGTSMKKVSWKYGARVQRLQGMVEEELRSREMRESRLKGLEEGMKR